MAKTVLIVEDERAIVEILKFNLKREGYETLEALDGETGLLLAQTKDPDLILLDGGRGQVSAVRTALAGTPLADVPLFGMVKDDHHRTRAIVTADGQEIALSMHRGVFTFITGIQDEVHRFSIQYQRRNQKKKSYSSTLTAIPGVGPATAKALLAAFGSVGAVREATLEQLTAAKGVNSRAARAVWEAFHSGE